MTITPIYLKTKSGKVVRRYLAQCQVGNVFVSTVGHTHMYAIHKAFQEITRPH